ncbi:DUF2130 domain-containing protein [Acetobacteraceae bacterium]|nr:DUF2130 domain-containing protein [Acetobacteraceae bacterium]
MNEIKCPHCHKEFPIDAESSGYADIVKQVHDAEFQKALAERLKIAEQEKQTAIELAEAKKANEYERQSENARNEIKDLQLKLKSFEEKQKQAEREKKAEIALIQAQKQVEYQEKTFAKENEIQKLKDDLARAEQDKKQALDLEEAKHKSLITEAVSHIEKERDHLKNSLIQAEAEKKLSENALKEQYQLQIQYKDEEIERIKDFKQKQSTKMLGESLEQHCENSFNQIRAMAFPVAHFGKDNDASAGSKGDYIFREADFEGNEIVSIMFEMKNEGETTATKHKNADFFAKLHKDRENKKCEYAVLVSMLETDSELYNTGIVDVSTSEFPKMYVIRPQFFIQMIGLLRNAGKKSLEYKAELERVKSQDIDVTNFEAKLEEFKSDIEINSTRYRNHFEKVIKGIEASIKDLEKTKKSLEEMDKNLRIANDKAQNVTIKRLTHNNPTMQEKFKQLER